MLINREFFHKVKLTGQLIFQRRYSYRVEVEKYFLGSSDVKMLSFYFFSTFEEAQRFALGFSESYYCIKFFKQVGTKEFLCNILSGEMATPKDIQSSYYLLDKYGFEDILSTNSDGWFLRGGNTHSPDFVSITTDLDYLLAETRKRYDGKSKLRVIIRDLFAERHPGVATHYLKNFEILYRAKLEL